MSVTSRPLDPQGSPHMKILICTALREVVVVITTVVIIAIILFVSNEEAGAGRA